MTPIILALIIKYSVLYNIDPLLAVAVVLEESHFNADAISSTGDVGLFQLNSRTFKQYSREQLLDPKLNIKLGIKYLAEVREKSVYKKDLLWLNGFNVGPETANTYKYPDKFKYYKEVKSIYDNLKAGQR